MTEYVWELGIDWSAIEPAGVSYLRGGLFSGGLPSPGTAPVRSGDTIIFRIFDVSSSVQVRQVAAIDFFGIFTKAAVVGQEVGNPLSNLQPAITLDTSPAQSSAFGNAYCSWTSATVAVTEEAAPGRFLLTIQVQAIGQLHGNTRLFRHDPEMVVGPNT